MRPVTSTADVTLTQWINQLEVASTPVEVSKRAAARPCGLLSGRRTVRRKYRSHSFAGKIGARRQKLQSETGLPRPFGRAAAGRVFRDRRRGAIRDRRERQTRTFARKFFLIRRGMYFPCPAPRSFGGDIEISLRFDFVISDDVRRVLLGEDAIESDFNRLQDLPEVENIYLIGDFCVSGVQREGDMLVSDGAFALSQLEMPTRISAFGESGFPFYIGEIVARKKIRLHLREGALEFACALKGVAVRVLINGKFLGDILWNSRLDATEFLLDGENEVELHIYNDLRNLFGPHHNKLKEPRMVGFTTFADEPGWCDPPMRLWTDRYYLKEYGVAFPRETMKIKQEHESFVLQGEKWKSLRYADIDPSSLVVYRQEGETRRVFPAQAYEYRDGKIRRAKGSPIPDFSVSPFYDLKGFDHEKFSVWGNEPYMLFADYECCAATERTPEFRARELSRKNGMAGRLKEFFEARRSGEIPAIRYSATASAPAAKQVSRNIRFSNAFPAMRRKSSVCPCRSKTLPSVAKVLSKECADIAETFLQAGPISFRSGSA